MSALDEAIQAHLQILDRDPSIVAAVFRFHPSQESQRFSYFSRAASAEIRKAVDEVDAEFCRHGRSENIQRRFGPGDGPLVLYALANGNPAASGYIVAVTEAATDEASRVEETLRNAAFQCASEPYSPKWR